MNDDLIQLMLIFLTVGVLFNLWLSLRLVSAIRYLRVPQSDAEQLSAGSEVPDFVATRFADGNPSDTREFADYAKVWLFLSSKCDKCKGKLVELEQLRQHTMNAGVYLQILTEEPKRAIKGFLNGTALSENTLQIDAQTGKQLNPQGASPYYLFVDQNNVVQAEGFIGDENWLGFSAQIFQSTGAISHE